MFSCCALFSTDDHGADPEHLKELDEIDASPGASLSLSIHTDGNATARTTGETPLSSSPRTMTAQHAEEAAALTELAQHMPVATVNNESIVPSQEKGGVEMEVVHQEPAETEEAGVAVVEEAGAAAQVEVETTELETLGALREAEDAAQALAAQALAAQALAAEAEKRRSEEEASARAARQAESEARKAQKLAEEAQKAEAEASQKAAEERAAAQHVTEEEDMAKREAEAVAAEEAKRYVTEALASEQGLRLQKHGRNARTTTKRLYSTDKSLQSITWGKTVYDLTKMQEVRIGTEADPINPGLTGTPDLRRSKKAKGALDRSFSLLFPERSLDFTASSKEECHMLVAGFQALGALHRS